MDAGHRHPGAIPCAAGPDAYKRLRSCLGWRDLAATVACACEYNEFAQTQITEEKRWRDLVADLARASEEAHVVRCRQREQPPEISFRATTTTDGRGRGRGSSSLRSIAE